MIDRQKLETVLARRFPGSAVDQIASAANAIMGLEDEWEEVTVDSHSLAREVQAGAEFRVLRRKRWADSADAPVAGSAPPLLVRRRLV